VIELDHILIATSDLDFTAEAMASDYGLGSIEGGRHPDWGTANRIIPLGDAYLELVPVVDPGVAAGSAFGRWVASGGQATVRPLGWAVRADSIDALAQRLGLRIDLGSRLTPDGQRIEWRTAGIDEAAREPCLPFFIEWREPGRFPGRAPAPPRLRGITVSRLDLEGDSDRLSAWLGAHDLRITLRPGVPRVLQILLSDRDREIAIASTRG
jgi:hypothetical protein